MADFLLRVLADTLGLMIAASILYALGFRFVHKRDLPKE